MTSSKPYLVRALYEWILDNGNTPYILVQNLEMTNEFVSFSARFNGASEQIFVPVSSLLAIYARENGEGMMFPADGDDPASSTDDASAKPKSPTLTVVK